MISRKRGMAGLALALAAYSGSEAADDGPEAAGIGTGPLPAVAVGQPEPTVEYLANEGVLLTAGDASVLIDALFGDGLPDYPIVPAATRDSLEAALGRFGDVDLVLVTHLHDDHFDPVAVSRHLEANPEAVLVAPGDAVAALPAEQAERYGERIQALDLPPGTPARLDVGGIVVEALGLAHAEIGHVGYRVELPGLSVLHLGDAEPTAADLAPLLMDGDPPNVALVPYWILTTSGGAGIIEAIGAGCVAAFHLEREGEDSVALLAERAPSATILDEPRERLAGGC